MLDKKIKKISLMLFKTKKETEVKKQSQQQQRQHNSNKIAYRSCSTRWQTQCSDEERRQTNTDKDETTRHDDRQEIRPIGRDRD